MLHGLSVITNVMVVLASAPFDFHLTGSRFFGYENSGSDWDFFVGIPEKGMDELRRWLTSNGFHKETHSRYTLPIHGSNNTAAEVWIHNTGNVHIQVVSDATRKAEVQRLIKAVPELATTMARMDKIERALIWKIAHTLYDEGVKSAAQSRRGLFGASR